MTDRHMHCVYLLYDDVDSPEGKCLLKDKKISWCFSPHCKEYVPRPSEVITYFIYHKGICTDWVKAENMAYEYLEKVKFNNYPMKIEEDEE